ncbi:cell differentiation protein rcd1 [Batrachochytrium salamandrivorans]|nr:cell differentiation protein rcd1 [Batrachochytrium salamandrivorans]
MSGGGASSSDPNTSGGGGPAGAMLERRWTVLWRSTSMVTTSGTYTPPSSSLTSMSMLGMARGNMLPASAALGPTSLHMAGGLGNVAIADLMGNHLGNAGVVTIMLQEIVSVYPMLTPPTLTGIASNRVCNALALLQCIASHNETRTLFLGAHIPLFLYPFLNTTNKTRPFEYLRLTSLGVIGALVKNDNSEVINFLLSTEIIPLCLRIMETGSELSKTVAIFIVQKILLDDMGLNYICQTYERFYAVGTVLSNMVSQLIDQQSIRLLKHVIRCYLRLSDNGRAREALRQCLPDPLRDNTFAQILKDDITTKR